MFINAALIENPVSSHAMLFAKKRRKMLAFDCKTREVALTMACGKCRVLCPKTSQTVFSFQ